MIWAYSHVHVRATLQRFIYTRVASRLDGCSHTMCVAVCEHPSHLVDTVVLCRRVHAHIHMDGSRADHEVSKFLPFYLIGRQQVKLIID